MHLETGCRCKDVMELFVKKEVSFYCFTVVVRVNVRLGLSSDGAGIGFPNRDLVKFCVRFSMCRHTQEFGSELQKCSARSWSRNGAEIGDNRKNLALLTAPLRFYHFVH